jgi:Flp pilus assembly protein TadD
LAAFRQALAVSARDVQSLSGRGVALDLMGRSDGALASHTAAHQLASDNMAVANNRAMSLLLETSKNPPLWRADGQERRRKR